MKPSSVLSLGQRASAFPQGVAAALVSAEQAEGVLSLVFIAGISLCCRNKAAIDVLYTTFAVLHHLLEIFFAAVLLTLAPVAANLSEADAGRKISAASLAVGLGRRAGILKG